METTMVEPSSAPAAPIGGAYEFTSAHNAVIKRAGWRTRFWGILTLLGGVLMAAVGVVSMLTGDVAGLAVGVIYGLLALIPILVGLYFMRSGASFLAVVNTSGSDVPHLMRSLDSLSKAFLVQIVAAVIWFGIVVVGIVAAVAIPQFGGSAESGFRAAQRSDLRNLVDYQEIFRTEDLDGDGVLAYGADMAALVDFAPSEGVSIRITAANEGGWAALSTHAETPGSGCAIYVGTVTPPRTLGGVEPEEEGEPTCDQ